jgi:hypothetical protein
MTSYGGYTIVREHWRARPGEGKKKKKKRKKKKGKRKRRGAVSYLP